MTKRVVLSPDDFVFCYSPDVTLNGTPLGEDDFFAYYGHEVSQSEIAHEVERYYVAAGMDGDELIEFMEFINDQPVKRLWAIATEDEFGEWLLSWGDDATNDPDSIPISLINLQ